MVKLTLFSTDLKNRSEMGLFWNSQVDCSIILIDCEQSRFFFRFSKGSARARERWAAKPRNTRNEGGSPRRKKRLLVKPDPMKYALASKRKIRLADAWSVHNKLSTIETIDKLMMTEALQECLSRFPKKNIDTEQREAYEGLISPETWRDRAI